MTLLETVFVLALLAKMGAELVLEALNRGYALRFKNEPPKGLHDVMDDERYRKSIEYTVVKSRFGSGELIYDSLVTAIVVLSGFLPWVFELWTGWFGTAEWSSALFLIALMVVLGMPGLPWEYWNQFKIEQRFGFNRSTLGLWITDKLKGGAIGLAIGFPLLWFLISLVGWLGTYWWLYGFAAFFGFQLLMMVLYPMVIMPLFNKLEPLEDGDLKDRLMALSDRAGFKAKTIQVMDGSKRSGHSNAFFTGFGKFRRIVLYDTLIEQLSEVELEAVLAHEIGHYKKGHIPKMLAVTALMTLVGFWIVDRLAYGDWSASFFGDFGFTEANLAIAFLLFSILGGLFTFWLSPLFNVMSRKHEYEADEFAKNAMGEPDSLKGALRGLSEKNLSNLNPHPMYSGFHYSHPTLLERERALGDS